MAGGAVAEWWNGLPTHAASFWKAVYDGVAHMAPGYELDWLLNVWLVNVAVIAAYWLQCGAFHLLDLNCPKWIGRFRVQGSAAEAKEAWCVNKKKLMKTAWHVFMCQLFINIPTGYAAYHVGIRFATDVASLPDFTTFFKHMLVCALCEEVGFYYFHRLMHYPSLYRRFHKIHHEWSAPVACVAVYNHPFEHFLVNLVPLYAGPILCNAHLSVALLWILTAQWTSVLTHCGYHFPWMVSPQFHDFHHETFTACYGVLGLLDMIHNTGGPGTAKWRPRHLTYFSPKPPFDGGVVFVERAWGRKKAATATDYDSLFAAEDKRRTGNRAGTTITEEANQEKAEALAEAETTARIEKIFSVRVGSTHDSRTHNS